MHKVILAAQILVQRLHKFETVAKVLLDLLIYLENSLLIRRWRLLWRLFFTSLHLEAVVRFGKQLIFQRLFKKL